MMLRVDNWHSELTIQACQKILEKYKVKYEIKRSTAGPFHNGSALMRLIITCSAPEELAEWMDMWKKRKKAAI